MNEPRVGEMCWYVSLGELKHGQIKRVSDRDDRGNPVKPLCWVTDDGASKRSRVDAHYYWKWPHELIRDMQ